MAPKKKKKKKDKEEDVLKQVDRTFYELEIQECNRKIARLQSKCVELETENEAIRGRMVKSEEDRADVISHLKRSLNKKSDEIDELQERIEALMQAKQMEASLFKEKISNMDNDFKVMQEQLSSEIKLLNGKLNSLEEYRSHREELMLKFENQEKDMQDQANKHDKEISQLEKAFLIRKERLALEMEERILKLSEDYQKMVQSRIAATTQGVIRENITVNNELNILVKECHNLSSQVESLKVRNKELVLEAEVNEKTLKAVQRKNILQSEIIKEINLTYEKNSLASLEAERMNRQEQNMYKEVAVIKKERDCAINNLGVAKQRLQAALNSLNDTRIMLNETKSHAFHVETIITQAHEMVKNVIRLSLGTSTDEGLVLQRANLLKTLNDLLESKNRSDFSKSFESLETIREVKLMMEKPSNISHLLDGLEKDSEIMENEKNPESVPVDNTYVKDMEERILKCQQIIRKIKQLSPDGKSFIIEKEMIQERFRLLNEIEDVLNPLNQILVQTMRPDNLPSFESVILDDGLIKMAAVPPEPLMIYQDLPTGEITPCIDPLLYS